MADAPGMKLRGRLRIELAAQFGDLNEIATSDFDMVLPVRVTGEGAVGKVNVDETELSRRIRAGADAFAAAVAPTGAEQPVDRSVVDFCEQVLELKMTPWQARTMAQWFAARGARVV